MGTEVVLAVRDQGPTLIARWRSTVGNSAAKRRIDLL